MAFLHPQYHTIGDAVSIPVVWFPGLSFRASNSAILFHHWDYIL